MPSTHSPATANTTPGLCPSQDSGHPTPSLRDRALLLQTAVCAFPSFAPRDPKESVVRTKERGQCRHREAGRGRCERPAVTPRPRGRRLLGLALGTQRWARRSGEATRGCSSCRSCSCSSLPSRGPAPAATCGSERAFPGPRELLAEQQQVGQGRAIPAAPRLILDPRA